MLSLLSGIPTEIIGHFLSKIIDSSSNELTSDLSWKIWKTKHGFAKNNSDFPERYAEVIIELRKAGISDVLLNFFVQESVFTLIHNHWYRIGDESEFEQNFNNLAKWFTINEQIEDFSVNELISYFFKHFAEAVNINRTAGDVEIFKKIDEIQKEVIKKKVIEVPKYLTNIPTIDLEKEFIGRTTDLQQLRFKLNNSSKVLLINGLGGIGKTVLAMAYVQIFANEYDHVIWINRGEDMISSFALNEDLADYLNLPFNQEEDLHERFRNIMRKLRKIPGCNLLVIDNVQEQISQEGIFDILPSAPNWKLLLTSRLELNGFDHLKLDVLTQDSSSLLFRTYYKGSCDEYDLHQLFEEVGYHTLTIELLAKLLDKLNHILTVQDLTKVLCSKHLNTPDIQEEIWARYSSDERGIYMHLMKAFQLSRLSDQEKWTLSQFVLLPVEQYSIALLADFLKISPLGLNKILNSLAKKGWLTLYENKFFSMHRLIQKVVNYQIDPKYTDAEILIHSIMNKIEMNPYNNPITECAPWLPYAIYIEQFFISVKNITIGILQTNIAEIYQALGQYEQSLMYNQKAKAVRELLLPYHHSDLAQTYNNIAVSFHSLGKYQDALDFNNKALEIRKIVLEPTHPDLAQSLNNIGTVYQALERHNIALKYHQESIFILESILKPGHPYLAYSYNNIAEVFRALWKYEEALHYNKKALTIRKISLDTSHPDLAQTYNNLGATYYAMRQFKKSLKYYHQARLIRESILSENHPDLAQVYNNIALTYQALKNHKEALKFNKKSLIILESTLPIHQPHLITCYKNIILVCNSIGDIQMAANYRKKLEEIQPRVRFGRRFEDPFE